MKITEESYGQAVILICSGELTEDSLDVFKSAVEHHLGPHPSEGDKESATPDREVPGGGESRFGGFDLVFNFEAVPFVDSAALEYLLNLQERCAEKLGRVRLTNLDENVAKIFEITRLDSAFERFDDVSEAVKAM